MTHRLAPAAAPLAVLSLALAGCVVGPNYAGPPEVAPQASAAAAFHRGETASTAAPAPQWWLTLNDAQLNRLMDAAIAANPTLEVSRARIAQSRASLRSARAARLPNIQASAAYLRTSGTNSLFTGGAASQAAAGGGAGAPVVTDTGGDTEIYNLGGVATWEPDFFGGKTRAVESARARQEAAAADLEAAQVSLTAEVANAYVSLRDAQARLELNRRDAAFEGQSIADANLRLKGGTLSELDVERLNDQLQAVRAEQAPLQAQIAEQLDRLAMLTGREPGAVDADLAAPAALPLPPADLTVGDPAGLLRRRPDICAAERRIAAANAVIGQRTADLFPKVTLFGNLGLGGSGLSDLTSGDLFTYALAPFLQWRPFDFDRTQSQIALARGQTAEAVADYKRVVLGALQDAETSLSRYMRQRERLAALARVQASADKVATMTAIRVKGGTASTIDQLDAERRRLEAQTGVLQARTQLTLDYVTLQKSLGLGWQATGA